MNYYNDYMGVKSGAYIPPKIAPNNPLPGSRIPIPGTNQIGYSPPGAPVFPTPKTPLPGSRIQIPGTTPAVVTPPLAMNPPANDVNRHSKVMDWLKEIEAGQKLVPQTGGRSKNEVASLQQKLVDAGYNIKVDGIWGPKTQLAYDTFTRNQGINSIADTSFTLDPYTVAETGRFGSAPDTKTLGKREEKTVTNKERRKYLKDGGGIEFINQLISEYKKGGKIYIKPENKRKFTATKKKTGKSTEELTHSKNPVTKKRAIFAQNAAK